MQFSDITNKTGILQGIEEKIFGDKGYGRITDDTDLLYQFTNRVNRGLDRFYFLAMTADGRWQWDDNNYQDTAIATTNIVANQRIYVFALEHLEIEKVLIKDDSGVWRVIDPINSSDSSEVAYIENNTGRTGLPTKYDKRGDVLYLDLTPSFNSASGLKIYFRRGADYFVYSDTTKKPGFASVFHHYLVDFASAGYAIDRQMAIGKNLFDLRNESEAEITTYFSKRNRDERQALTVTYQNNR